MKYIDSEKLKAEIERLIKVNKELTPRDFTQGIAAGYADVLSSIESLEQEPSLPANVDEAAEKCIMNLIHNKADWEIPSDNPALSEFVITLLYDMFKAGAEWMAEQGETIEGTLGYGPHLQRPIIMLEGVPKFYDGHSQEVIVNIRKK